MNPTDNDAIIPLSAKRSRSKLVEVRPHGKSVNPASGEAVADGVKFPRCDVAVRNLEKNEWALADAILAECPDPGPDGVKNNAYGVIEALREGIAKNHGVDLSFERIRKLRKVAAAFPPGRRRPAVSLEAHLEAGTPEALDKFIKLAPAGSAFTREFIRGLKRPNDETDKRNRDAERRRQTEDQRVALQDLCRQKERECDQLEHERDHYKERYLGACRSIGREPVPPPPAPPKDPASNVDEGDLKRAVVALLMAHGIDVTPTEVKVAIQNLVAAALAQHRVTA